MCPLWVSPKGEKVWRLAYRVAGKPQTISLGRYPDVTLAPPCLDA